MKSVLLGSHPSPRLDAELSTTNLIGANLQGATMPDGRIHDTD
ncbi:MAG: hypothetical protein ACLFT9_03480 [Coleofasciculus sp.]